MVLHDTEVEDMNALRVSPFLRVILAVFLISQIAQGSSGFFAVDWGTELDPFETSFNDKKEPATDPSCLDLSGGLTLQGPCPMRDVVWWDGADNAVGQKLAALWPDPTGPPTA